MSFVTLAVGDGKHSHGHMTEVEILRPSSRHILEAAKQLAEAESSGRFASTPSTPATRTQKRSKHHRQRPNLILDPNTGERDYAVHGTSSALTTRRQKTSSSGRCKGAGTTSCGLVHSRCIQKSALTLLVKDLPKLDENTDDEVYAAERTHGFKQRVSILLQ
jgi:hypothetical protein